MGASAVASSEYGKGRYDAAQAAGAPDVPGLADDPKAWCPTAAKGSLDWIELTYERPVRATEVRVRQSFLPGCVVRIEGLEPDGSEHVLWEGSDSNAYPPDQIAWLAVRWPATAFLVQRVRLTLDMSLIKGWKQIDAVQLVGD